jgi:hypothetical protein
MQLIYKYIGWQFKKPTGFGGKITLKTEQIVDIQPGKSICVIAKKEIKTRKVVRAGKNLFVGVTK